MNQVVETSLDIKEWFSYIKDKGVKVDLWITDPPYPFDNKNGTNRFLFEDKKDSFYDRMTWNSLSNVFSNMYNESSDGSRAYVFSNKDGIFETQKRLLDAGWIYRNIIVWDKIRMGMGCHWRHRLEYILYFSKGKPLSYVRGKSNILSYKKPLGGGISDKPPEIWEDIMVESSLEGDVCADPFSGSNPMKAALVKNLDLSKKIGKIYTNSF